MNFNLTLIIGILGALILLIFFLLQQANKISNKSFYYDLANFLGSTLLIIYSILIESIPFAILNFVWAIYSLRDMIIYLKNK